MLILTIVILIPYCIWILYLGIRTFLSIGNPDEYAIIRRTPKYYHDHTKYNWAGAIFLFLLYFIFNPIGVIFIFFDWLFRLHLGGRNK